LEKPLKESIEEVKEKSRVVASTEKEIDKAKLSLEAAEKDRKAITSKLNALRNSASFKEIATLQERKSSLLKEKQEKKTELVSLMASIDKPLKRFSKAIESGRAELPATVRETVQQLQQNPLQLFKKDPKGETIKAVLQQLKKAIETGTIELKEREKDKRLSTIDELLAFNFFSENYWKFNEIDSKLQSIEKELKEKPVVKEISLLEEKFKEAERAIQETGFSLETLKARLEKEREALSSLRQRIEELLQEISAESVYLK